MAKLKYDRPINIPFTEGTQVTVPKGEVWKLTAEIDRSGGVRVISTNLYGGVRIPQRTLRNCHCWRCTHRDRLQTHRRLSDSMEVALYA